MKRIALLATTIAATLLISIPAFAQEGVPKNCDDFASQGDAQNFYNTDPSDPEGLDSDGDGKACEQLDDIAEPPEEIPSDDMAKLPEGASASVPTATKNQYSTPSSPPGPAILPETGGSSLLALGVGILLLGGGLITHRIVR